MIANFGSFWRRDFSTTDRGLLGKLSTHLSLIGSWLGSSGALKGVFLLAKILLNFLIWVFLTDVKVFSFVNFHVEIIMTNGIPYPFLTQSFADNV